MIRLPFVMVKNSTIDAVFAAGEAATWDRAERLVDVLAEPLERGDIDAVRQVYVALRDTLGAERLGAWKRAGW